MEKIGNKYQKEQDIVTHLGDDYERFLDAVVPPIFMNSLHVIPKDRIDAEREYVYGRVANPTTTVLEKKVAALECADTALAFGSGMAAITSSLLSFLKKGDHVICVESVYGPTRMFIVEELAAFGVGHTLVNGCDIQDFANAVQSNTKVIYLESPSSMVFQLQDLRAVAALARAHGIVTMIDNSYATPVFQKPIAMGIDISLHTMSKYMGGHSDIIAGVAAGSHEIMERIMHVRELYGCILGPMEAWLAIRGLRTLPIRMQEHRRVGMIIAQRLAAHPAVKKVYHPGLECHSQYELAKAQMTGCASPLSIVLNASIQQAQDFVKRLKLFNVGPSWGGYESMITYPRGTAGFYPEGIIRMHVGLEDVETLWKDLEDSLNQL